MSWRLATTINAAIALVAIIAVVIDLSRTRNPESSAKTVATEIARADRSRVLHLRGGDLGDIAHMRVDKLGSVPPSEFYEVLLRATPAEIIALALKFNDLPNDGPTTGAIGMFFQAWAELDGKTALATAFQIKDLALKKTAAGTVVGSVSPSDCRALVTRLIEHPDTDLMSECKGPYLDTLLERWAFIDAPGAAKFLGTLGDKTNLQIYSTGGKIARAWATVDPYSALTWVDQQKDASAGETMFNEVIEGWCSKDMTAAATYVAQHLDRADSTAVSSVAGALFQDNPKRATNWLNDLPFGEAKAQAEGNLAFTWAQKDPLAVARWVEKLPPNDQKAAVVAFAGVWASNNWPEASKWLAGLNGDLRDDAVAAAISSNPADIPPAESLPLALSIANRQHRSETVRDIVVQWAQTEPAAAAGWIQSSSLSKQEKQYLLSQEVFLTEPGSQ